MSLATWILTDVFPNYQQGTYYEISKTSDHQETINFHIFRQYLWKIHLNYLLPINKLVKAGSDNLHISNHQFKNKDKFQKILAKVANGDIIHCFVAHTSKIYKLFNKLDLTRCRFGVIILKCPTDTDQLRNSYQARTRIENNYYHFYQNHNGYDCYVSSIGAPPYYLGQRILDKYTVTGNFKSGCGSSGVYMVRDSHNQKLVLKKSSSSLTFHRELQALQMTKGDKYSPSLIDFNNKSLILVTNWCGQDLKLKSKAMKLKIKGQIQKIHQDIIRKYKLYHNDIRWKNITFNGKNLVLIDWGMSEMVDKERDHDHILEKEIFKVKDQVGDGKIG